MDLLLWFNALTSSNLLSSTTHNPVCDYEILESNKGIQKGQLIFQILHLKYLDDTIYIFYLSES